jgi:signal transduction histidine kinase
MAVRFADTRTRTPAAALLAVARLVAECAPEDVVFAAVCEQVAHTTGASATSVLRYVGDERAIALGTWRQGGSRGVPVNAELDFDHTNSALGRVRVTRRPARAEGYDRLHGELPALMQAIGLRATVAAPILLGDEPWGAIVASTSADEPLPPESEPRLVEFAELVALAVASADERRRLARAGVHAVEANDASRRRLERGLHEGAHQHLVSLALKLRVARTHATGQAAELLDDALAEAMAATVALRDLSRSLHPAMLSERGLPPALLALAARSDVPVHLRELPGRRFAPVVETTAYKLAAEALAEATAAGATEVGVRVGDRGEAVVVKVTDDGRPDGRPREAVRELGARVVALGGALEAGAGVVRATLPL